MNAATAAGVSEHGLLQVLHRAAVGVVPPADGAFDVVGSPPGPVDAVIAFTAHHVIAADVDPEWVNTQLPADDLSAPMRATFVAALGERLGSRPGSLDVVLSSVGAEGDPELDLVELTDAFDHPRVARARRYRTNLRVFGTSDGAGVLVIGRGLAGRSEVAFEVASEHRGRGLGRALVKASCHLVEPDTPLFMQAAPGNAASLRAVLAGGFRPIGSEVLFVKRRP